MKVGKRAKWVFILPLCLWVGFIFVLSSQPYSQQSLKPYLNKHISKSELSRWLPDVSIRYGRLKLEAKRSPYDFVDFVFRKTAHGFVYAVLGALGVLALRPYAVRPIWPIGGTSLMIAASAMLDEWNQTTRAMRTGELRDIGIDLIGGLVGVLIGTFIWYAVERRRSRLSRWRMAE